MKRFFFLILIVTGIVTFTAAQTADSGFKQEGVASWYGKEFEGKPTASGEIFNPDLYTAAHPNLPFGTILMVTNKQNMRQVTVRVNDRGPFVASRIIDVSRAAAEVLGMINTGTAPVIIEQMRDVALDPVAPVPAPTPTPVTQVPEIPAPAPVAPVPAVAVNETSNTSTSPEVTNSANPVPEISNAETNNPTTPQNEVVPDKPSIAADQNTQTPTLEIINVPPDAPLEQEYYPAPTTTPATLPSSTPVVTSTTVETTPAAKILGGIPPRESLKSYRLQVGAFIVPENAIDVFDKLKNAGLSPAYEKNGDYYRVVLAGLKAEDIPVIAQTLGNTGFKEAIIREEN